MKKLPLHSHVLVKTAEIAMQVRCCIGERIFCKNKEWRLFAMMDRVKRRTQEWPNQARIGHWLGMKPSACSRFVDSMVKQGYVKRVAGEDRRSHCIAFTPKGEKLWVRVSKEITVELDKMLEGLSGETIKTMTKALNDIEENIRSLQDGKQQKTGNTR